MPNALRTVFVICLIWAALGILGGAYLRFQPVSLNQPDGSPLELYASGDEYYNWLHDKDGFTARQNDAGWYVYLDKNARDELIFTSYLVGKDNPVANALKPWTNISPDRMLEKRRQAVAQMRLSESGRAPTSGTLNNLAIFIRFSDQAEYTQNSSVYNTMFNGTTGNTMQSYFLEASYNALNIPTSFYPVPSTTVISWQDSNPRAYYSPYSTSNTIGYSGDTERRNREFTLLVNAVNGVSSQIPTSLNLDGDNDGLVDNVCFIIQGSTDGWAELLWPHRWAIYDRNVYINGKRVYDFNFQLSNSLASSGVGVLCHEMFHSLGAPDLYHYSYDGMSPVGSWDLMENNANPPQHMSAFMKYKYGNWIPTLPTLTTDGTYNLNPLTSSTNNCFKIPSPNSTTEYFVVEYRRKTGTFENSLPGTGLLVYRINTTVGDGNADGPPDEVYLYRPNGTTTVNGSVSSANYSLETGRTAINSTTNPTPFLTNGSAGGLNLNTIGSAGATISFVLGNPIPGAPSCTIDSPANGTVFALNSTIPVSVTATDSDGTITGVAFYLDNSPTPSYTDTTSPYSWNWNTTGVSGGEHTIKAVATDNNGNTAQSTVTVTLLAPADEGFETGNFSAWAWTNNSPSPWFIQSSDVISGTYAARSGAIDHSNTTSLSLPMVVTSAGNISFYQKISSEANYDFLKFYIDGVEQGSWSGSGVWTLQTFPVSSGTRTFTWTYSKDGSVVSGSDCAFLDHIIFPPHGVYYAPPQNLVALGGNGYVNLTWSAPASGTPNNYKIYRDGSLLTTLTGLNYTDSAVTNGTTYNYYLIAVYTDGQSDPTPTVSATPGVTISVEIGSGTSANGTSTACPVNVYYKSEHGQSVYTRAELNALGISGPMTIIKIGFDVVQSPIYALPNFIVRMGHTSANDVTDWIPSSSMSTVFTTASYAPVAGGYDMLTLSTPFQWNGNDNIVIDTAFSLLANWNSSGTTRYTSVNNGYRYIWNDYNDMTDVFADGSTTIYRPNVKLTMLPVSVGPQIVVNPLTLNYGSVSVGSSSTLQFTIQNTGDESLTGAITTPTGYTVAEAARSAEFGNAGDRNTLNYSVTAGTTKTYNLSFAPTAVTAYNGSVSISSNDPANPTTTISLTGTGAGAIIAVNPNSLSFGAVQVGANATLQFTVQNSGNSTLTGTVSTPAGYTVGLAGRSPGDSQTLQLALSERNTLGITVNAGSTNTYNLSFAPQAVGSYDGTVTVNTNAVNLATVNLNVSGSGYTPPNLSIDDANLAAVLHIGGNGSDTFTMSNSGSQSLTFSLAEIPAVEWFSATPLSGSVAGGGNQLVTGSFSAAGLNPGTYNTILQVSSNDPDTPETEVSVQLTVLNHDPTIDAPATLSFDMYQTMEADFTPWVGDLDGQPLTLGYSGNTNIQVAVNGLYVNFSAVPGWFGSEEITFSVFDGYAYAYDVVAVTVNFVNTLPTIALPATFEFDMNGSLVLDFSSYLDDVDGQPLTLGYSGNSNVQVAINGYEVTFSALEDWFGSEEITFSVFDGYAYAYDVVAVTVNFVNTPPTIALPATFEFDMNGSLVLDFSSYLDDVDGQPLTLGYSGNSNIQVAINGYEVTFSALEDWFGSEEITFSVFDGYAFSYDSVVILVNLTYLAPPAGEIVTQTATGTTLVWEPVPNATHYKVYRSSEPYGTYTYLGTFTVTAFEDSGFFDRAFYRIVAVYQDPSN